MSTNKTLAVGVLGMTLVAGAAVASPLVTFTYTNLNGSYAHNGMTNTGTFTAVASNSGGLVSDGSVSRIPGPGAGTAVFQPGFVGTGFANFSLTLSVFNKNIGLGTAQGSGSFTATSVNGSVLSGTLIGDWINFGGATFFNGAIYGASFSGPTTFAGTSGSFATNVPGQPLDGSLVQLFFDPVGVPFFNQSFTGASTGVAGQLVPTPASAALIALGGLIAARRRR